MSDIIQHLSDNSTLPQPDRSISGVNHQQIATAVQFAVNFIFANLAGGCDGHIQIDVSVAAVEAPAGGQSRAGGGSGVDAAVSSFEFEFVKAAVGADVAIAGQGSELTVHFVN